MLSHMRTRHGWLSEKGADSANYARSGTAINNPYPAPFSGLADVPAALGGVLPIGTPLAQSHLRVWTGGMACS
jgi:hypothetical protein